LTGLSFWGHRARLPVVLCMSVCIFYVRYMFIYLHLHANTLHHNLH